MKITAIALIAALALGVCGGAGAFTAESAGARLDRLVIDSPTVLIATVIGQRFRAYGENELPYTVYTLHPQKIVYGVEQLPNGHEGELELPVFGGLTRQGRFVSVVDNTELTMGETYLLFLKGGKWSLNPFAAWSQGVFRLVFAGREIGHVVLTLDDRALMGVDDGRLVFRAPDFQRGSGAEQRPPGSRGGGFTPHERPPKKAPAKPHKGETGEAERRAQRERNAQVKQEAFEPEAGAGSDRAKHLEAWLGSEPMSLEVFSELVSERRDALADQVPKERRRLSLEPVPPAGKGMKPPPPNADAR